MAMAVSSGKGGKFVPPLPHGWEARYDDDNKSYFFIDHIHKKTQWEDPRFKTPAQQHAHPQTHVTSASAASSLGLGGGPMQTQGAVAMQDLSPHHPPKSQSQNNRSIIHESNLTNEVDTAVVNKLKADFPKATKELIIDMLTLCHNSERETREQLNDLGFLANNSKGKSSNHASPHHNKHPETTTTKKSPEAHQPAPVASAQSAPKKELSEGDKKRMLIQAKGYFPKCDPEVIRLAMIECNYEMEELKILLNAWEKRPTSGDSGRTASSRNGSTSVVSSASSVRSFSPPAGSLEPVGFEDTFAPKLKGTENSQASTQPSGNTASPKRSTDPANMPQSFVPSAKGDAATSAKSSCSQHARAKQVTKPKQPESTGQPVVTSQPAVEHSSKVRSKYRTESKGPDASLRKGPDSTLLTSDYTQANGPDKRLYSGPNRSYLSGPRGAAGPDISLRCGPQNSLLQENKNNSIISTSEMLIN